MWGGLRGYHQLAVIGQALAGLLEADPETSYLRRLQGQVERALSRNQALAQDLAQTYTWLKRIAACLRYPPRSFALTDLTGAQVQQDMKQLLRQFQPDFRRYPAQAALHGAWHRLWRTVGPDLLPCYDLPGLPPDNLKLESFFGRLRCHQRRISGRKSTRALRDLGHYQVLFSAENETELLDQLRQVPLATYQAQRHRLAEAEAPRQFLHRLHRRPLQTMTQLIDQHTARRSALATATSCAAAEATPLISLSPDQISSAHPLEAPQLSQDNCLERPGPHPIVIPKQAQTRPFLVTTPTSQPPPLLDAF